MTVALNWHCWVMRGAALSRCTGSVVPRRRGIGASGSAVSLHVVIGAPVTLYVGPSPRVVGWEPWSTSGETLPVMLWGASGEICL
jgi:hypothetical protein